MNCIIIDDDDFSRKIIEKFVEDVSFLTSLKSFPSAIEAISFVNSNPELIHLIFLDIEMPEMNGLDFLESLKHTPQIIITSKKEAYAIDAFEYNVTDYVLKPVTYDRLMKAVEKANQKFNEKKELSSNGIEMFIKTGSSSITRVKFDEIIWIEALENYIQINTVHEKYVFMSTMKGIMKYLPENKFLRIHRSYIVHINCIYRIEDNALMLKADNKEIMLPITKANKDDLISKINIIL